MHAYRVSSNPRGSGELLCYAEYARNAIRTLGYNALLLHKNGRINLVTDKELELNARAAAVNYIFLENSKPVRN